MKSLKIIFRNYSKNKTVLITGVPLFLFIVIIVVVHVAEIC